MDGKPRTFYLSRLNREFYQGDAVMRFPSPLNGERDQG